MAEDHTCQIWTAAEAEAWMRNNRLKVVLSTNGVNAYAARQNGDIWMMDTFGLTPVLRLDLKCSDETFFIPHEVLTRWRDPNEELPEDGARCWVWVVDVQGHTAKQLAVRLRGVWLDERGCNISYRVLRWTPDYVPEDPHCD